MKKNSKENIKGNSNSSIKITSSPPSSRKSNPAINRLITPDSKTKGENYTTRLSNYTPNFQIAFSLFLLVRLISAFNNQVADCDETFNYWEPTHYLMYGWGFQTWEYRFPLLLFLLLHFPFPFPFPFSSLSSSFSLFPLLFLYLIIIFFLIIYFYYYYFILKINKNISIAILNIKRIISIINKINK